MSESWLSGSYNAPRADRVIQEGGVAIYGRNNLKPFVKVSTSVPSQFQLLAFFFFSLTGVSWLLSVFLCGNIMPACWSGSDIQFI